MEEFNSIMAQQIARASGARFSPVQQSFQEPSGSPERIRAMPSSTPCSFSSGPTSVDYPTRMDAPSPSMRSLARRLLAASQTASNQHVHEAVLVSEKLGIPLTKFAGADGFASLLQRALVLASADVPSLKSVKVGADRRLEGLEQLAAATGNGAEAAEAAVAITANLLGLLVTFIGESLTLRLVREAWPEVSLDV